MKVDLPPPKYTNPNRFNSASLPAVPPFGMKDVTCRAFPLKANMAVLNSFCDAYLNMDVPPEIAHFRPTLPYVYLMALDYGAMSPESIEVQNLGWVAQHELLFMVPLQQWRKENGRLVFKNWACVSPFIFVDDAMSQRTGREVYGWPKVLGKIEAEVPVWARDPRLASRVFNMNVKVFPKTFAGDHQEARPLVDIKRDSPPSLFTLPVQASNAWNPFNILSNAVGSTVDLSVEAIDMLLALRMRGYRTNRSPRTLYEMTRELASKVAGALPDLPWTPNSSLVGTTQQGNVQQIGIEQVTLKQFQDAENPLNACYQAIISSTMSIDRLNAFGFLGDVNLLRGDTSGGFTVRIHRYDAQPIIDTLGIEVGAEEEADDGTKIAVIKPTLPFWTDVDLNYGKGVGICSRIPKLEGEKKIVWRDGDLNPVEPTDADDGTDDDDSGLQEIPFNMARGAATQAIAGPFHYPDATIQIYPLMADKQSLQRCLDEYVNSAAGPSGFEFEALGSYAYLMVNVCGEQHGNMWSESNNIGSWAEREVSFCIPVKWYENTGQGRKLQSLAIVEPFVFENSGRAVLTSREINGRAAVKAEIDSPKDVWLDGSSGPDRSRNLLKLETEVFPALNLGQPSEQRTLMEIDAGDVLGYTDEVPWRLVAENWGEEIVEDLQRKAALLDKHKDARVLEKAKAMALEIFTCDEPINWINVKQYRDTDDAEIACYQAVVHTSRRLTDIYDIREIESRVHVRLHRYPGQPIAETLGLKIKHTESRDGEVVQSLQPIRPFWMRVAYSADLGRVLCWRSSQEVTVTHPWFRKPGLLGAIQEELPEEHGYFYDSGYTRVGVELGEFGQGESLQRMDTTVEEHVREQLLTDLARLEEFASRGSKDIAQGTDISQELKQLSNMDLNRFVASKSVEELYQYVEGLCQQIPPEEFTTSRIKRSDAAAAIEDLDEIQVVIESILSDEWGHWGNPRWNRWNNFYRAEKKRQLEKLQGSSQSDKLNAGDENNVKAEQKAKKKADLEYPSKPEVCIRYDSIGSDERGIWYEKHSDYLSIFDGDWLYYDPDKKPGDELEQVEREPNTDP